jgi:hypothetical protein
MLFLSHSTKDKSYALNMLERLLRCGYSDAQLFLDSDAESGIQAGADWKRALHDGVRNCSALIVLYSTNWRQSDWCSYELGYAKAVGKEIFPVLLEAGEVRGMSAEHQAVSVAAEGWDAAFARLWKALEAKHLGPKDIFQWPHPALTTDCPFPGLPAFDERYAAVFFGREQETDLVLQLLRKMRSDGDPRLLMIHGGSGSGKSSLLRAGIVPRLNHQTADREWLVLPSLRFGTLPDERKAVFDWLGQKIAEEYRAHKLEPPDWEELSKSFAATDATAQWESFWHETQRLTHARGCSEATVLLVMDQFDEVLATSAASVADAFLQFLQSVFCRRNPRLLAIGTLRSDFLDVYERHRHALKSPFFQTWRLEPFPHERIRDVIVKPASRSHVQITDELAEKLRTDTPTAEALPHLAFTLEKLWEKRIDGRIERAAYDGKGGL